MKKILFASTALVLTAGYAAAEVTVGGDGRMGVVYEEDSDGDNEFAFNSRIRISFTATGETDTGLAFGGSIRADNAAPGDTNSTITDDQGLSPGDEDFDPSTVQVDNDNSGGGVNGLAGNVFIQGAFGKLSMGDVDSGAKAAVGQVSGVGYTGIGDRNEIDYLSNPAEAALFEGSFGGATVYGSISQINEDDETYGIGVSYTFGDYTVGAGFETSDDQGDNIVLGGSAGFGAFTAKAVVSFMDADFDLDDAIDGEDDDVDMTQFAISLDYVAGATTVTGFVSGQDMDDDGDDLGDDLSYGIGAAYDLGGGAALKGGLSIDGDADDDSDLMADFGITMSF